MTKIRLRELDRVEQLRRFISYRLGKELGLGTLIFDPCGDILIFYLDIAEREYGKKEKEELFEFLMPYHKARVVQTLQGEAVKQKLWISASGLGKEGEEFLSFDEEGELDE